MSESTDDLTALLPQRLEIEAGGEKIAIGPIRFRQIPRVKKSMEEVWGRIDKDTSILDLICEEEDAIASAVAVLVDKSEEWVKDLELDQLLRLVTALVNVNADFFSMALSEIRGLTRRLQLAGVSSSSN